MGSPTKITRDDDLSLPQALEHVVTSLADIVDKRFELLQLDARAISSRLSQAGMMLAVGIYFAAIAWAGLMALTYVGLADAYSPAVATGAIVAINVLFGVCFLVLGRRQLTFTKRPS